MPATKIKIVCRHVLEHENIRPFGARMGGVGGWGGGGQGSGGASAPTKFPEIVLFFEEPFKCAFFENIKSEIVNI